MSNSRVGVMVFNATFNNISAISWRSILLVEETGILGENHQSAKIKRSAHSSLPMLPIYLHFFLTFLYDIVYYCYYSIPKLRDTHQYNNVIIIKTRVKKISDNIRLQHVVFGYTIFDKEYFHLNYSKFLWSIPVKFSFDYPAKYSKL
jgi:hypothetical protein